MRIVDPILVSVGPPIVVGACGAPGHAVRAHLQRGLRLVVVGRSMSGRTMEALRAGWSGDFRPTEAVLRARPTAAEALLLCAQRSLAQPERAGGLDPASLPTLLADAN